MKQKSLFVAFFLIISLGLNAQDKTLVTQLQAYQKAFPVEKIYLSFDKPYYNVGDTVWFKSFLLNADFSASGRTDRIYLELFNDSLSLVEKRVIVLNNGLGYGDIALNHNLKDGTYTLRAYSNWQQNFGPDYFYQKSIYIGNSSEKTWLLDAYQKLNVKDAKKTLNLKLKITNIKNEPAGLKDVEIFLLDNKKKVMRADLQTTKEGKIETSIPLNNINITKSYRFVIVNKNDNTQIAVLPINLSETDQIDLQFMPEAGYLVAGTYGRIAFKAVGPDGKARNVSGKIVNRKNETVAEFSTLHMGMGSFFLLAQQDEIYKAVYLSGSHEANALLPIVHNEGTSLRVEHLIKSDSILVYARATPGKRANGYKLLAQGGGETIIDAQISLANGISVIKLAKKDFPNGVIHFTLFSPEGLPLNERQALINHKQISLKIVANKSNYAPRDSISLELSATTEVGSPLSGSFSIAVTDANQVATQGDPENIASYFLLQSDLKGDIEDPGWYFSGESDEKQAALDVLMLTQGWIGYQWDNILQPIHQPKFIAEKDNLITGSLTNLMNKPVPDIRLTLLSTGKTILIADTVSNAAGKFTFKNIPLLDSPAYTIKIKNAKGKIPGATIKVDEFVPATNIAFVAQVRPWYVTTDTVTANYFQLAEKRKIMPDPSKLKLEGNELKEVEILGKTREKNFIEKTAWDSHFFKRISKEELQKTPRKTLLDLLKEKLPGFTIGSFYADGCMGTETREIAGIKYPPASRPYRHQFNNFLIGQILISHVMIDKVNTHLVANGVDDEYNGNIVGVSKTAMDKEIFATNNYIFNTLNAEDILDITIYKGCAYYFLDITTRSGKGPWIQTAAGVYVYRPIPIYLSKEFYSPKYTSTTIGTKTDFRSTIFWDANLVTDENGKAKVSFYAADLPSTYTIKIEGTDLNGRFGYQKKNITIVHKTESK